MKIILTGTTGMIGLEVLKQSISNASITSIIVLSRRPLPSTHPTSPKIKVHILEDFSSYPPSMMKDLSGAEACIWALGGPPHNYPNLAAARKANIDYPYNAAQAFIAHLCPQLPSNSKFRFIYISGKSVDRDLSKTHRFFNDAIHMKGEIENLLLSLQSTHPSFSVYIAKPGSVIPPNNFLFKVLGIVTSPIYPALKVEELAAVMIDVALHGGNMHDLLHEEIEARGRSLLGGKA